MEIVMGKTYSNDSARLLISGLAMCGLLTISSADEVPRRWDRDLSLTPAQIVALKKLGEGGDNEACARLAKYYDFYAGDKEAARIWFEKAARNGHVQSQYNLGVRLMYRIKDPAVCREARAWFQMALDSGEPRARKAVDDLGDCAGAAVIPR
jgi:TPR repeat protein